MALNPANYQFLEDVTITDEPLLLLIEFMRCFYYPTDDSSIHRILHSNIFEAIDLIKMNLLSNNNGYQIDIDKQYIDNHYYLTLLGYIAGDPNDRKLFQRAFISYNYNSNINKGKTNKSLDTSKNWKTKVFHYRKILLEINMSPQQFINPVNYLLCQAVNWTQVRQFKSAYIMEKQIYQLRKSECQDKPDFVALLSKFIQARSNNTSMIDLIIEIVAITEIYENASLYQQLQIILNEWFPNYVISDKYPCYHGIFKFCSLNITLILLTETRYSDNADMSKIYKTIMRLVNPPYHQMLQGIGFYDCLFPTNNGGIDIQSKIKSKIKSAVSYIFNNTITTDVKAKTMQDSIYQTNPDNDDLLNDILS
jgi:hypothetical protein